MESLETLKLRLSSMSDLKDIVGVLRALAAVRVQEAQGALQGIRVYSDSIGDALGQAANLLDAGDEVRAVGIEGRAYARDQLLIVFMSEHGFVGGYNEVLLARTIQEIELNDAALFVVGSRGLVQAEDRGLEVAGCTPMVTHQASVLKLARSLANEVYRRISKRNVRHVSLAYARSASVIASDVTVRTLLPLDLGHFAAGRAQVEPLHTLPPLDLVQRLTEEYVMAELAHVVTEALASENGARLKTMDNAHENISEKLDELKHREHQMRQEQITIELLEVMAGAEAMMGESPFTTN